MKAIFTEGSLHHLKTMEVLTVPRVGELIVIGDQVWSIDKVAHLPKEAGRNQNESIYPYDPNQDADLYVHLVEEE